MSEKPAIGTISVCRACGETNLVRFLSLSQMPFTDDFIVKDQINREFLADINVFVCEECWTVQTQHDVDVSDYYEDYQYSVGGSSTASKFMRKLAQNLQETYYLGVTGQKVLEIGSGDGGQLQAFKETGCQVLGYEPSSALCEIARADGISAIQGLFSQDSIKNLPRDFQEVDVIVLSYTFDHLPDPRSFLESCRSILNPEHGLLVIEVHDFEKIIERREYCLFEHEHSIYLTEETAQRLCGSEGFEVIDFDLVVQQDRRANSLIFVATPHGSNFSHRPVNSKTPNIFSDLGFYLRVENNVQQGINNLDRFIRQKTKATKRIAGYGAGGRGVMTLAAMETSAQLCYLVDKQPKDNDLFVPKSHIPLVGLERLSSDPVDELIVFSFGYMSEIQAELAEIGYKPSQLHSLLDLLAGRY